jgi:hypothetical protein
MSKHTWNYRIASGVDPKDGLYYGAIYEVHYTDGVETAMSSEPATFGTDLDDTEEQVKENIVQQLEAALKSIKKDKPFHPPKRWNVKGFN